MTPSTLTIQTFRPARRPLLFPAVRALWRAYRQQRDAKRSIAALRAMDDRMLKDIGISRCEIEFRVLRGGRLD